MNELERSTAELLEYCDRRMSCEISICPTVKKRGINWQHYSVLIERYSETAKNWRESNSKFPNTPGHPLKYIEALELRVAYLQATRARFEKRRFEPVLIPKYLRDVVARDLKHCGFRKGAAQ